ncbi:MAG: hypothetical protein M1838_006179 [Thelocarpon superellum]|nr:MAG: hypothetical protein M1838_006179 [Thelocarpon superellum]
MGGNTSTGSSVFNDPAAVRRALDIVRNNEAADVDPHVSALLERALAEIWRRIQARPTTYVLSADEFAVFNFHRHQFGDSELAQSAIQRFWDHYRGSESAVNGP